MGSQPVTHLHYTMGHNRSPTFTTRWVTTGHSPSLHDGSQPVTHLHHTMGHNRSPTFTTRWAQPVTHLHHTMGHNRSPTVTTRWATTGHTPSPHAVHAVHGGLEREVHTCAYTGTRSTRWVGTRGHTRAYTGTRSTRWVGTRGTYMCIHRYNNRYTQYTVVGTRGTNMRIHW